MPMTIDDAIILAKIAETVDGGCRCCAEEVVEKLNVGFPYLTWKVEDSNNTWTIKVSQT